jgi:hypothetical protein
MLVFRIVLLCILLSLVGMVVWNYSLGNYESKPSIVLLGFIAFTLFPIYIIWSLCGIVKIEYSILTKTIHFKNIIGSGRIVHISEIVGYYQTTFKTKYKNYSGYIFKLDDGKTIEITEYNLSKLRDFYSFIVQANVPCLGSKNSWYPLKRKV